MQSEIAAGLNAQVEYTNDDLFGSNIMLGIAWRYDETFREGGSRADRDRLTDFVRRNYNIIVANQTGSAGGRLPLATRSCRKPPPISSSRT